MKKWTKIVLTTSLVAGGVLYSTQMLQTSTAKVSEIVSKTNKRVLQMKGIRLGQYFLEGKALYVFNANKNPLKSYAVLTPYGKNKIIVNIYIDEKLVGNYDTTYDIKEVKNLEKDKSKVYKYHFKKSKNLVKNVKYKVFWDDDKEIPIEPIFDFNVKQKAINNINVLSIEDTKTIITDNYGLLKKYIF